MIRMNEQTYILTAQGVSLSEQISRCVQNTIYTEPISVLNNAPNGLLALEQQIYPIFNTMIRTSPCNGIFVILDATTNTQAPGADISRAGMYLRFANLNSRSETEQDLVLYRGIPTIAREHNLELGRRRDLEIDSTRFPIF